MRLKLTSETCEKATVITMTDPNYDKFVKLISQALQSRDNPSPMTILDVIWNAIKEVEQGGFLEGLVEGLANPLASTDSRGRAKCGCDCHYTGNKDDEHCGRCRPQRTQHSDPGLWSREQELLAEVLFRNAVALLTNEHPDPTIRLLIRDEIRKFLSRVSP